MLRKRLIFTLLYDNGQFMLSRNFRLQRVGDILWLEKNYNFSKIAFAIDELIVLDVSRGEKDFEAFCESLKRLTEGCFVPIAAGGGIRSVRQARELLRSGADKTVVNTPLFQDADLVSALASEFGQQCVVASVDVQMASGGDYRCFHSNGGQGLEGSALQNLSVVERLPFGELYLNSMNRDGTGQGYDISTLGLLSAGFSRPVILAGGAGNARHLAEGLADSRVDAVATAHLFNFVGDGLQSARKQLLDEGVNLASWAEVENASA